MHISAKETLITHSLRLLIIDPYPYSQVGFVKLTFPLFQVPDNEGAKQ